MEKVMDSEKDLRWAKSTAISMEKLKHSEKPMDLPKDLLMEKYWVIPMVK